MLMAITGCGVSSLWIQNPKDFCLKLRIFKGLLDIFWKWNLKSRPHFGKYNFQTRHKLKVPILKIELLLRNIDPGFPTITLFQVKYFKIRY